MILDKNTLFADNMVPSGATTAGTVINLGSASPGKGKPIRVFLRGSAGIAGAGTVVFTTGNTTACSNALMTYGKSISGAYVELDLPSTTEQYLKATLTSTAGVGTWSGGIILEGGQTNR